MRKSVALGRPFSRKLKCQKRNGVRIACHWKRVSTGFDGVIKVAHGLHGRGLLLEKGFGDFTFNEINMNHSDRSIEVHLRIPTQQEMEQKVVALFGIIKDCYSKDQIGVESKSSDSNSRRDCSTNPP